MKTFYNFHYSTPFSISLSLSLFNLFYYFLLSHSILSHLTSFLIPSSIWISNHISYMLIYLFIFSSPTLLHLHFSLPSNLKSSLFKPTHIPITITITIHLSFLLSSSHHRMVSTKSTTRRLSCGLRNIPITPVFIPCSYAVLHNTSAVPLS